MACFANWWGRYWLIEWLGVRDFALVVGSSSQAARASRNAARSLDELGGLMGEW